MDFLLSPAVLGGVAGGVAGGLAVLIWGLLQPNRECPDCSCPLPKIRKVENPRQRMWGGWTCPNCKCDIDRKGNKRDQQID